MVGDTSCIGMQVGAFSMGGACNPGAGDASACVGMQVWAIGVCLKCALMASAVGWAHRQGWAFRVSLVWVPLASGVMCFFTLDLPGASM